MIAETKRLIIFDFDDTLVTTDAKIKITNKGLALSTLEFAKYKRGTDDVFDFSEFHTGELKNPRPTRFFKTTFRKMINTNSDIMILTARQNTNGIKNFLSQWINPAILTIVGNKDKGATSPEEIAQMKKDTILSLLNKYKNIIFYDDNINNIEKVRSINNPKIKTRFVKKQIFSHCGLKKI